MKFVIYAPGDFTENGGGCIALHKLCHNIAWLGEECYIMTSKMNPEYKGQIISMKSAIEMCGRGDTMAIYPEVTIGNPFHSPHVMRWILYFVREYDRYGEFGFNDLIYKYAPIFTLRHPYPIHGELRAMELNLDLFYDRRLNRSGSCYLKKKNPDKAEIHPAGSLCLDNYTGKGGLKYLADVFNRYDTFYAYDDATWVSIMAALCGCRSIVVPGKFTADEWYSGYPYFQYGISYGTDEENLEHAKSTVNGVRSNLVTLGLESIQQTKSFIQKAKEVIK